MHYLNFENEIKEFDGLLAELRESPVVDMLKVEVLEKNVKNACNKFMKILHRGKLLK